MKERILKGWNFWRVFYMLIGILMIIQAASYGQWIGILLGIYLSSMGLFGFGCAGGTCYNGSCELPVKEKEE
ncbi:hypothetical protein EZJ28_07980 [Gramella sp. KN1008]|nr:hypothetical protein EZJ28_07980 [Gramella sp. KN1008]